MVPIHGLCMEGPERHAWRGCVESTRTEATWGASFSPISSPSLAHRTEATWRASRSPVSLAHPHERHVVHAFRQPEPGPLRHDLGANHPAGNESYVRPHGLHVHGCQDSCTWGQDGGACMPAWGSLHGGPTHTAPCAHTVPAISVFVQAFEEREYDEYLCTVKQAVASMHVTSRLPTPGPRGKISWSWLTFLPILGSRRQRFHECRGGACRHFGIGPLRPDS